MKNEFILKLNKIDGIILYKDVKIKSFINIKATFEYKIVINNVTSIKKVFNLIKKYNVKYYIIGNCSNILFKNSYYKGCIIDINLKSNKYVLSSKENISRVNQIFIKEGISSFLFLSLVPASLGGAICMNAGAYNKEMKDIIEYVYFFNIENEKICVFDNEECEFKYRDSYFKNRNCIILGAKIKKEIMDTTQLEKEYKYIVDERVKKIPYEYPNLGSVFKNFDDIKVAKLLEECNVKGLRVNDAIVSEKHSNVIVNRGCATGMDVINLINIIKMVVYIRYKRRLELEIIIFE